MLKKSSLHWTRNIHTFNNDHKKLPFPQAVLQYELVLNGKKGIKKIHGDPW